MLPPRCFTCGHVLANLELEYEDKLYEIDNNMKLNAEQKIELKQKLIDNLLPNRWKTRYCCRARFLSYVDLIKIIV
jgi:DNA-directed RNA polymerase subunit N (RpoN/RPB10)